MNRARIIVSLLLLAFGALVAWPLVRTSVTHHSVPGQVIDVLLMPQGRDQVRVRVAYEFQLPNQDLTIAWTQGDARFRPVADPVMGRDEAERLVAGLYYNGENRRPRPITVYYRPNQPQESAFFLSPAAGAGTTRHPLGLVLASVGLLGLLFHSRERN